MAEHTDLSSPRPSRTILAGLRDGSVATTVAASVAFVLVATIAILLRQRGTPMWRTVWAEDGGLFYADALYHPLTETLFRPHAGYGQLAPRFLATVGTWLPAERFALWASLSSAVLVSLMALFVFWASTPLLRSPLRRAILAGAIVLLPVLPVEVAGSICTLHIVMPIACLFAVLFPVDRLWPIVVRTVIVVVSALSSPLSLLFFPIVVWQVTRLARSEDRARLARWVVPVGYLAACLAQIGIYLRATRSPALPMPLTERASMFGELVPQRIGSNLVFGVRVGQRLWDTVGFAGGVIALIILVGLLAWKLRSATPTSRAWSIALVVAGVATFGWSVVQRPEYLDSMMTAPGGPLSWSSTRYEVFSQLLVVLALLIPNDTSPGLLTRVRLGATPESEMPGSHPWRCLVAVTAVWLVVAVVPSFRIANFRSDGPVWYDSVQQARAECPSQPRESKQQFKVFISPASTWAVPMTCGQLEAPTGEHVGVP